MGPFLTLPCMRNPSRLQSTGKDQLIRHPLAVKGMGDASAPHVKQVPTSTPAVQAQHRLTVATISSLSQQQRWIVVGLLPLLQSGPLPLLPLLLLLLLLPLPAESISQLKPLMAM